MACDQIAFFQRKDHIREGSAHVINVTFRDRATAANVTPTNVYYRIDDLNAGTGGGRTVLDWTSVAADDEITLTITAAQNALTCQGRDAVREVLVAADYGLSTQYVDSVRYAVENLQGIT